MGNKYIMVLLLLFAFILTGCGTQSETNDSNGTNNENTSQNQSQGKEQVEYLYENEEVGLKVAQTTGWNLKTEKTEPFNIVFENGQAQSIISVIESDKSFEDLKSEFLAGAGKVSVVANEENYLSYQSNRKESMETNIYLDKKGNETIIISFVYPTNKSETLADAKSNLRSNINY